MAAIVRIKFYGVRAIHPAPGRQNQTTGGNTSSIELHDGSQRIFINAGFGINIAGDELFAQFLKTKTPVNCTVLFSDFMWDATMGLPFFTPIHFKSTELDILTGASESIARSGLNDVASQLFSPFNGVDGFRSGISIRMVDSAMELGAWTIQALTLPHPLTPYPVTIWRLSHISGSDIGIVLTCNNDDQSITEVSRFLTGCKTLICAASTSPDKDGWDLHRTGFLDALAIATSIGAEDLHLTHYHPRMTDVLLQRELTNLQNLLRISKDDKNNAQIHKKTSSLKIHLGSEIEEIFPASLVTTKKTG